MNRYMNPHYTIALLHALKLSPEEFVQAYRKGFPKSVSWPNQEGHEKYCRETGKFQPGGTNVQFTKLLEDMLEERSK